MIFATTVPAFVIGLLRLVLAALLVLMVLGQLVVPVLAAEEARAFPEVEALVAPYSVAGILDLQATAIVPIALPPGRESYNLDALWGRIATELDEARLVQLDRLRVGHQGLDLRELAQQLGRAGRFIVHSIVKA